ncbi:hypothetical protein SDC9_144938 [bioreactor metagenome]|uniref:Uncharacterized protein n=1 Tax=bioreactor metagenome TaxID=1076179 RepID=A0A645E8K9_9ZZZZ
MGILAGLMSAVQGVGEQVDHRVHQHEGAQAQSGAAADHGEDGQIPHAGTQPVNHLGVGKLLAGEVFFHHFFAGFGNGFLQGFIKLGHHRLLALGNLDFHPLAVLNLKGALVEHVNDPGDLLIFIPDGSHQGRDIFAEALPQGREGGIVVAVFLIGLGNVEQAGHFAGFAVFPCLLGAHAHAVLGGADNHRSVGHPQSGRDLAGEIEIARRIQDVDFAAVIFNRSNRQRDGNLALDFLRVVITNGIAIRTSAQAVNAAGEIKHGFGQGGLSIPTVTQQTNIANGLRGILHSLCPLLVVKCTAGAKRRHIGYYNIMRAALQLKVWTSA